MNGDYEFNSKEVSRAGLIIWMLEGTRRNGKSKRGTFRRPDFIIGAMEHFGEYVKPEQVETLARQLEAVVKSPQAASRYHHTDAIMAILQNSADRIRANRSVPAPRNETAKKMLAFARRAAGQEDKTTARPAAQPKESFSRERMEKGLREYVNDPKSRGVDVKYVWGAVQRAIQQLPPRNGLEEAVAERMSDRRFRSRILESTEAREQNRRSILRAKGDKMVQLHARMEENIRVQRERGEVRFHSTSKKEPTSTPPTLIHGPKWKGLFPEGDPARKKTGNGKPKGPPRPRRKR